MCNKDARKHNHMNTREELQAELSRFGVKSWLSIDEISRLFSGTAKTPSDKTLLDAYRSWKRSKHRIPFFAWVAWTRDVVKDFSGYTRAQYMQDWMGSNEPRLVALWLKQRNGVCIWQGNCGPQWKVRGYGFKHEPGEKWRSGQIFFLHPDKELVKGFMLDCKNLSIPCEEIERKYALLSNYKPEAC